MSNQPSLRYLSLGGGRQSTALYLLACDGAFGEERPSVAIFADTQDEDEETTYPHLDRLDRDFGHIIPIQRVTNGKLSDALREGGARRIAAPPFYVRNKNGGQGMLRRQCTREYKIEPIIREVRRLLGVAKGRRVPKGVWVESWQGISLDEASRMRDSQIAWARNRYALIFDHPMTVEQCVAYNLRRGYPAPKSACYYCPYTDDARWRDMKANRPRQFAKAVVIDHLIRLGKRAVEQDAYVHRSLMPLDQVDFSTAEDRGQVNMFENECEGMWGV